MHLFVGLTRLRDNLMAQLQELNRSKPRGKADENIIAEITRLESVITVARDDLVRSLGQLSMRVQESHRSIGDI